RAIVLLTTRTTAPFEGVRSVCEDTGGRLWAVVWEKGEVVWSTGQGWTPLSANDGWSVLSAQCVAADPAGGVWIGTSSDGLYGWQNGKVTASLSTTNGLAGNSVSALLTAPSGELWIGAGMPDAPHYALQRRASGQLRTFPLPGGSGPVVALALDAAGDCWAATSSGFLLRVRGDSLTDETKNTLAEAPAIRTLLATPDGSLWIGYGGMGLGRLKAGRFSLCRMEQGLPDDYISQILPDGRGRLWIAGNRGIFSVREKELDDFAEGRAARVRSISYRQKEGLPSLQAGYDAWPGALRSEDGRLLFPMQSGIAVVYADDIQLKLEPPPVVIERVTVDGKTVAAYGAGEFLTGSNSLAPLELGQSGAHLHLPPGQRQAEFVFTALSFTMPEAIGFKYRLSGLDANWVDAGARRVAAYPRIPPGHYHFQVIACNSDGMWNETGAALALTAEPHRWETVWFRVVGPLALFGLLGGWTFLWLRRRNRLQIERLELRQATERERARIAADLHDDLGAGLTQISLNAALIKNPAVTAEVAGNLLQEIDQRSRELVTALDEIVWAVNPKNDTVPSLVRYLCQFAQNYLVPNGIVCRLEVVPDLPDAPLGAEQRHNLFLAFKEALHNTLRHSGASQLRLAVAADAQTLSVTLADNGRGFVPSSAAEGADGLGNMRTRLTRLGGSCVVTSVPNQGTTVVFCLPLVLSKEV
ncbi:MAG: two-component regulator propeller domain-containing protein, partial [bacterium]